jgi:hypothetical protein
VSGATATNYDLSPDSHRFLIIRDNAQNTFGTRIVVVLNPAEELKQLVARAEAGKV